jgi:hypothetical protein
LLCFWLRDNAVCGAQRGAPLMTGALMSARYDMEATEGNVAQLRERVELMRVKPIESVEVQLLSHADLRSTGGVA